MEHIELLLAGNDPLNKEKLDVFLNRPRAIDREMIKKESLLMVKKNKMLEKKIMR